MIELKDNLNVVDFPIGLAVRSGDIFHLEKWNKEYNLDIPTYAVALFTPPSLSELGLQISGISKSQGVVAVGLTKDGWGWIHLETNTKDYIGDILENMGALPNEWYRLTISYENPLKK